MQSVLQLMVWVRCIIHQILYTWLTDFHCMHAGFVETQGLAALSGAGGSGVQQTVIMWLMPLWLMSGVFALWSLSEASKHLAKRRGSKTLLQVRPCTTPVCLVRTC